MRLLFLGNGPFARPALDRLAASDHSILIVVARPDRPAGKHLEVAPGPIAARAQELGLPLFQPEDVNEPGVVARLAATGADLFVIADFGQILGTGVLASTRLGGVNIHGSLLPKYRGAAPVAWAIYHGESETGVSILRVTRQLDAGGVIAVARTPIRPDETAGELEARLAIMGADLILPAIKSLANGTAQILEQDVREVSRAPRLKKEDGRIDWSRSASQIHNQIRAMIPWPIAYTERRVGKGARRIQILASRVIPTDPAAGLRDRTSAGETVMTAAESGTVLRASGEQFHIQTGDGILAVLKVKPEGKPAMDVPSFLRGNKFETGERLG